MTKLDSLIQAYKIAESVQELFKHIRDINNNIRREELQRDLFIINAIQVLHLFGDYPDFERAFIDWEESTTDES